MLIIDFKRYIAAETAMLISAGIGALATGVNAGVNAGINKDNIISQNKANHQAFLQQKQLLALQQGYNSPLQQINRLRSAGLNPALLYGNGSAATGNVDSVPQSAPVGVAYERPLDFAGGMADSVRLALSARQQLNENQLAESRIALESAEGFELVTRAGLNNQTADKIAQDMGFDLLRFPYEVDKIVQDISESKSREALNYKKIEVSDAEISEISARAGLEFAETKRILDLLPYEISQMTAETAHLYFQTEIGRRQIAVVEAGLVLEQKKFWNEKFEYNNDLKYKMQRDEADRKANIGNNICRIVTTGIAAAGVLGAKFVGNGPARTVVKGF